MSDGGFDPLNNPVTNIATGGFIFGPNGYRGVLDDFTGKNSANAAGNLAMAQLSMAQDWRNQTMALAAPTDAELTNLQNQLGFQQSALQNQQKMLARQENLLDAIDPTLKESATQALQLLQGKQAAVLDPMNKMLAQQREQLSSSLAGDLGSGYASSTAGQAALRNFDTQAAVTQSQAQQQALGTLLSTSLSGRNEATGSANAATQLLYGANSLYTNNLEGIQNRQVNASAGTNISAYGGAPYVGALAQAQGRKQFYGDVLNEGAKAFGAMGGGPGGGMGGGGGGFDYGGSNLGSYFGGSNPYASR